MEVNKRSKRAEPNKILEARQPGWVQHRRKWTLKKMNQNQWKDQNIDVRRYLGFPTFPCHQTTESETRPFLQSIIHVACAAIISFNLFELGVISRDGRPRHGLALGATNPFRPPEDGSYRRIVSCCFNAGMVLAKLLGVRGSDLREFKAQVSACQQIHIQVINTYAYFIPSSIRTLRDQCWAHYKYTPTNTDSYVLDSCSDVCRIVETICDGPMSYQHYCGIALRKRYAGNCEK